MIRYFKNVYQVSKSLVQGMMVTGSWFFKPAVTVQFPREKLTTPERFRGALTFDKDTCTACNLCVKACPTACISLDPAVDPVSKKRMAKVSWYQIDFGKCNYCRLCEEACPTKPIKSVRHTHNYEWGMLERKEMFVKWTRETAVTSSAGSAVAPV
ncbi:MAG: NADH-quinone oxidoreductase subunit I [Elusimicrobia bacterium]|nr:NADH-quinone oxidoreductase subunit I [Elusimicrobiota bacterium]